MYDAVILTDRNYVKASNDPHLSNIFLEDNLVKQALIRLGLKTDEQRVSFRNSIRKIYGQKISVNSNYDFMGVF